MGCGVKSLGHWLSTLQRIVLFASFTSCTLWHMKTKVLSYFLKSLATLPATQRCVLSYTAVSILNFAQLKIFAFMGLSLSSFIMKCLLPYSIPGQLSSLHKTHFNIFISSEFMRDLNLLPRCR